MACRVSALLLLGVICVGFAAAEVMEDCCLETVNKPFPRKILASYNIQEEGKGCKISATVFITKAGRTMCALHPSQSPTIRDLVAFLDKRNKASRK